MPRLHRILFPTDFSACAESALAHAAGLAQRTGAELHVLHVAEPAMDPAEWVEGLGVTLDDVAADLDVPLPTFPNAGWEPGDLVPLTSAVEYAEKVAPAILRYAERHDVDLVVMGTHGRRGLRRMLVGSVAEEVVRLAPCPVLTVGGREAGEASGIVRRVVAPLDLSDPAALAPRHAAALADAYGADLDLLHVVDAATVPTGGAPVLGPVRVSAAEVQIRARRALERLAADLRAEFPAVGAVGVHVRLGSPAGDVVRFAEERGADLVVVGSHGRTGMERLLVWSVAERVVRSAPCPVLTVKRSGRSLLPPALVRDGAEPAAVGS